MSFALHQPGLLFVPARADKRGMASQLSVPPSIDQCRCGGSMKLIGRYPLLVDRNVDGFISNMRKTTVHVFQCEACPVVEFRALQSVQEFLKG
jgi:hypothetical protein